MGIQTKFNKKDDAFGTTAEAFFDKYWDSLTKNLIIHREHASKVYRIEGYDFGICVPGKNGEVIRGGNEVKAYGSKDILKRGITYNDPDATIGFEMYDKGKKGWLHKLIHPEQYPEVDQDNIYGAATPIMLAIIGYDEREENPYAAVVFDDFSKLLKRLSQLSVSEFGFDITTCEWPSEDEYVQLKGTMTEVNSPFWNISVRDLADIITVTIINDDPPRLGQYHKQRLESLKRIAVNRHLLTEQIDAEKQRIRQQLGLSESAPLVNINVVIDATADVTVLPEQFRQRLEADWDVDIIRMIFAD